MSADSDHSTGQPAQDQAPDLRTSRFTGSRGDGRARRQGKPHVYADASSPSTSLPGKLQISTARLTRTRLRAPRSQMVAGLTPSRLTRFWPRWSISSSATGWTSWIMTI
jgi:hypothetical protein